MENCKGTIVNNNYYCCCCKGKGNSETETESAQVGSIAYAHILQLGYMKANGDLLNRGDYSALYKYAKENNLILSETDWAKDMQGMFAEGDGVNTFRMPDLRGQFLRGVDDRRGVDIDRALGSQQGDAIRNITGNVVIRQVSDGKTYTDPIPGGCFVSGEYEAGVYEMNGGSGIKAPYAQGFDASRVVPTAEENRPKNIALIAQIKY